MAYGDPPPTGAIQWANPVGTAWQPGPPTPTCPRHHSYMRYVAHHNTDKKVWWCNECAADKRSEREKFLAERGN